MPSEFEKKSPMKSRAPMMVLINKLVEKIEIRVICFLYDTTLSMFPEYRLFGLPSKL